MPDFYFSMRHPERIGRRYAVVLNVGQHKSVIMKTWSWNKAWDMSRRLNDVTGVWMRRP